MSRAGARTGSSLTGRRRCRENGSAVDNVQEQDVFTREVYACGVWRKTKPLYVVSYYFATQGVVTHDKGYGPLRGSWRGNALPPHR